MKASEAIEKLEKEVSGIKDDVILIKESLQEILSLQQQMNIGLYGDTKNNHVGVIEKQKELEAKINELNNIVDEYNKKQHIQDLAEKTKSTVNTTWLYWGKKIIEIILQVAVVVIMMKGLESK